MDDQEIQMRKAWLNHLVQFGNDRVDALRKQWAAESFSADWLNSLSAEDRALLESWRMKP